MNSFQKVALLTSTGAITEASVEICLTAGYGTSVQPFAVKPMHALSQLDASKCWSKSCKASLVGVCFSTEFTVTACLPDRGWLMFSWLHVKREQVQVCLQSTEQMHPLLGIAHLWISADLARTLQNSVIWGSKLKLKMLLEHSLYPSNLAMTNQ